MEKLLFPEEFFFHSLNVVLHELSHLSLLLVGFLQLEKLMFENQDVVLVDSEVFRLNIPLKDLVGMYKVQYLLHLHE